MVVENISNEDLVCKIGLTAKETEAILHCLKRTSANGEQLTVSMELEDKLVVVIKNYTNG
jgi:hypothetical protein